MLAGNKMLAAVKSEKCFSSFYQKDILSEESPSGMREVVK